MGARFIHPRGIPARLSAMTGIKPQYISRIINGRQRPTPIQATKLEKAFSALGIPLTREGLVFEYRHGVPLMLWPEGVTARPAEKRPRRGARHDT